MRNPRFKVSFGYMCPMEGGRVALGSLAEQVFSFNDLQFFLRILSPFNSGSWIADLRNLRKGYSRSFIFDETTPEGVLKKVVKITR